MNINRINSYTSNNAYNPNFNAKLTIQPELYSAMNMLNKGLEFRYVIAPFERLLAKENPGDVVRLSIMPRKEAKKVFVKGTGLRPEDIKMTVNEQKSCGFFLNRERDRSLNKSIQDLLDTYHYIKTK